MERDDLIVNDQYPVDALHDEAHGVKARKNIFKVTAILSVITVVEVALGIMIKRSDSFEWTAVKWLFVVLTLVKAAYIILSFMHLGEERKSFRKLIIYPYVIFIGYLLFQLTQESGYFAGLMDRIF